ncbi:MAG: 1,2-phenylacetyl-CoA epoxidase subunit PaaC [Beijerinckiaceae bacterium]
MTTTSIKINETPLLIYALGRADDALILGHRLSEWCGHAPILEEEMALANMGLDLIGQARSLYSFAAEVEDPDHSLGHDEDKLAYLRDEPQYRNLLLVEQPNGDFAKTLIRQLFYSAFADPYWRAMMNSRDTTLAAIAAKSEKESAYHLRHASEWIVRLGIGTAESRRRTQAALEELWPFTGEIFEADASERGLVEAQIVVDPASLRETWTETLSAILAQADLGLPSGTWMQKGGRNGRHSEHLGYVLTELQFLQRTYPGAVW